MKLAFRDLKKTEFQVVVRTFTVVIWVLISVVAGTLYIKDFKLAALGMVAGAYLIHSFIQPRIAIYGLIVSVVSAPVVGGLVNFTVSKMFGLLAAIVSVHKFILKKGIPVRDPSFKWIFGFLFWALITVSYAQDPETSIIRWISLLFIWSMPALVLMHITKESYFRWILKLIIVGGIILTIFVFQGGAKAAMEGYERVTVVSVIGGDAADVSETSRILAIGIFAAIFLFLSTRNLIGKVILFGVMILFIVGVIFTESRACYVGIPFSIVASLLMWGSGKMRQRTIFVLAILLLCGFVFLVGDSLDLWGSSGLQERFESIFEGKDTDGGARIIFWNVYLQEFVRTTFMGNGLNMTCYSRSMVHAMGTPKAAHNDLISIAGDLGIVGVVLFAGLHLQLFCRIRQMRSSDYKLLNMMMWTFLVVGGLSMTSYVLKGYGMMLAIILVAFHLDAGETPGQATRQEV